MTVSELYRILDKKIPRELSCEWDNDGLMCCPNSERYIKKVLIALDVTGEVAQRAIDGGYDLIVSHHPLIFKGIKSITEENHITAKTISLIKSEISVFSFHTRLDALEGGVNDTLAELCGVKNAVPFGNEGIGRIGDLEDPCDVYTLAKRVKDALGCEGVFAANSGYLCKKVAVLGGSGADDIDAAMAAGADTYISGELKFHNMAYASDTGINLIEAGHFYTEDPVCAVLKKMIEEIDASIVCDVMSSNRITLI